jgi:cell division protein FtsQ
MRTGKGVPVRGAGRPVLLTPRERPGRHVDVGTRDALMARQRSAHRRQSRRSLRMVGCAAILGLGLVAFAVAGTAIRHALRTGRLFAVTRVEVLAGPRVGEAAVLAAASIERGTNLFALDPDAIEDRVMVLPGVRSVRVVRRLPNRVAIEVEEREPYALVNVTGAGDASGLFWIDAEGRLVGSARRPGSPPLPILSGVERPAVDPNAPLSDRLRTGLQLLGAIQQAGERAAGRISEIELVQADDPVLYTIDGTAIRVGGRPWGDRLARLDGVLDELEARGERPGSIDLRFRDQIVLRPRPGGPSPSPAGQPHPEAAGTKHSGERQ